MKTDIKNWNNYQLELRIAQLHQDTTIGPISKRPAARDELDRIAKEQARRITATVHLRPPQ